MEILTPFQNQLLKAIGSSNLAQSFYLTGGTALSAFYLHHRFSEDLDFFSADPNAVRLVRPELERVASNLGGQLEFSRTFNTFVECFITAQDGEIVKLDFAQDTPYRLQPTQLNSVFGVQLDSALDIAANKLAALFDRAAEKDFVDIFFVHRELIQFAELLPLAREKQMGMDDYWLAIALQRVRQVEILPRMIKPVVLADLRTFFLQLARALMAKGV
ncbi:MAG TPA: nucleotidyl transferase AbiEii/AbiGii toxin family protein [Chloroflexota bacterium]|nr:nucleotidyl transferase AbiEii/AbiGii toxin family protein [Chloroflexota bacterium]HUM67215.1 nucleotidyl transferase AbiEii/AbiGii toxin family protein [Chloroflexota bacterium]